MGVVEEVGPAVRIAREGDWVIAPFAYSDGTCEFCHHGLFTSCVQGGLWGGKNDGGHAEAIRAPHADGTLVVKSGQTTFGPIAILRWDPATAQKRMENLLTSSYKSGAKVKGVLSPYDGLSIGILSALKSNGYGTSAQPYPIVTGQDAEQASVKSIIAGEQYSTIYKDTRQLAATTVKMADAVLKGQKPEVNNTTDYNNGNKVVPSMLLQSVVVDKTNYSKELVDTGYYTKADLQ